MTTLATVSKDVDLMREQSRLSAARAGSSSHFNDPSATDRAIELNTYLDLNHNAQLTLRYFKQQASACAPAGLDFSLMDEVSAALESQNRVIKHYLGALEIFNILPSNSKPNPWTFYRAYTTPSRRFALEPSGHWVGHDFMTLEPKHWKLARSSVESNESARRLPQRSSFKRPSSSHGYQRHSDGRHELKKARDEQKVFATVVVSLLVAIGFARLMVFAFGIAQFRNFAFGIVALVLCRWLRVIWLHKFCRWLRFMCICTIC
jgi:hypothetical protein